MSVLPSSVPTVGALRRGEIFGPFESSARALAAEQRPLLNTPYAKKVPFKPLSRSLKEAPQWRLSKTTPLHGMAAYNENELRLDQFSNRKEY